MSPKYGIIGVVMPPFDNNRRSPYEFDLTAEPLQKFYTYGHPFEASIPCVVGANSPCLGFNPTNNSELSWEQESGSENKPLHNFSFFPEPR